MHKTLLFLSLLLGLMLAGLGCGKEDKPTIIKGRITNRKTGAPIEGVFVYLTLSRPKRYAADEFFTQSCGHSNSNGEFNCTLEGKYEWMDFTKEGYLFNKPSLNIADGKTNDVEISLIPRDGFLRLKIENTTGLHDTLHASIHSQTEYLEGGQNFYTPTNTYPLVLNQGETYTEIFALASPEIVQIMWGFNTPTYQTPYTFRDSIMVVPNDTVTYILSY